MRRILGVDASLIHCGYLVSCPGATLQGVHRDGKHLFPDTADGGRSLPPHCVTVFLPLLNLTSECGPTEFWPGTNCELSDDVRDRPSIQFSTARQGDAILFDYRVLHRGTANTSATRRPFAYFTYARSWFRDSTNYPQVELA
jgi:ectoine hydroxylase-related dioxygenase (phytanoyl-CoA dioxygenase family)